MSVNFPFLLLGSSVCTCSTVLFLLCLELTLLKISIKTSSPTQVTQPQYGGLCPHTLRISMPYQLWQQPITPRNVYLVQKLSEKFSGKSILLQKCCKCRT